MFIWAVAEPARLTRGLREAVASPDNRVLVSSATAWEIAIKRALGRLVFPVEQFDTVVARMGLDILPIEPAHAFAAGALPRHHADPFDRMLVAQAMTENFVLATVDARLGRYDVRLFEETGHGA